MGALSGLGAARCLRKRMGLGHEIGKVRGRCRCVYGYTPGFHRSYPLKGRAIPVVRGRLLNGLK